jgi:hypothetical protein
MQRKRERERERKRESEREREKKRRTEECLSTGASVTHHLLRQRRVVPVLAQHTPAHVSIRQHTSAYVSIHTLRA